MRLLINQLIQLINAIIHIIDFGVKNNEKTPTFKVEDHVRMSKYKKAFVKGYTPKWSEEVSVIKKVNNTVSQTYFINGIDGKEIVGKAYEKELQMTNETEFRGEKGTVEKK